MTTADESIYLPGNIYTVNERDWLLSRGYIEEGIDLEVMTHLLEIYVDYSMAEEPADDSGVFEFLLACLITHFERWTRSHYSDANRAQAPQIRVGVLISPCPILVAGRTVEAVKRGTEIIAEFFRNPYVPEGKLVDRQLFPGTSWYNDLVLRIGINSIALRPLVIDHESAVFETKMKALAAELSPFNSDRAHLFVTNTPALIGTVFTEAPTPMSEDAFLRQTGRPAPAYSERGSLETDDIFPVLSAAVPISVEAYVAIDILTGFLRHHFERIVGERAVLGNSQALWNDHIIISYAAHEQWTEQEAHDLICVLLGLENSLDSLGLETELTEDKLNELLIDNDLHEWWQIQLWLRRIESSGISPEGVREAIHTLLATLHIPHRLATGPLIEHFPPLLAPRGLRLPYANEDGYPPALDPQDLERQYLEPVGEQFWTGVLFEDATTVQGAPQRLTINDTEAVAEWFVDETPDSALIRRQSIAWEEVEAWVMYEGSAVLVDRAARFFELVPDIYLHAKELKSLLEEKKQQCLERGVRVHTLIGKRYRSQFARLVRAREFGVDNGAVVDAPWSTGPQKKTDPKPVRVGTTGSYMQGNGHKGRLRYLDEQEYVAEQKAIQKRAYYIYAAAAAIFGVMILRFGRHFLIMMGWI